VVLMRERSRTFRIVTEVPEQQPEGRLISEALKRSGRSARGAAATAGISDTRWRHIVSGYQPAGAGNYIPVSAPAETLARMAQAVGVTPDQLADAGRGDAAGELLNLRHATPAASSPVGTGSDPGDLASLSPEEIEVVKAVIRAMRSARGEN
jgi:hypothetical protein